VANTTTPIDPETITARILADHLRTMIEKAGTTVPQLADRMGVNRRTITCWLEGENLQGAVRLLYAFDRLGCKVTISPPVKRTREVRLT
jgi:transcriptional regulator with XRE-family HTH domain